MKKPFTISRLTTVAMKMHYAQAEFFMHSKISPKNRDSAYYTKKKELLENSKKLEAEHKALLDGIDYSQSELVIGEIEE